MIIYDIYDPETKTNKKVVWSNGLDELKFNRLKGKLYTK
jgi:hypothetical protein